MRFLQAADLLLIVLHYYRTTHKSQYERTSTVITEKLLSALSNNSVGFKKLYKSPKKSLLALLLDNRSFSSVQKTSRHFDA